MIFNPAENARHLGAAIQLREGLRGLECVESYLRERCVARGIEVSYDVTAYENPYFKTINYTTYAGLFIIHPLQFDLSLFQMYDAKADKLQGAGHLDFVRAQSTKGKYVLSNGAELSDSFPGEKFTKVIALPGSNKFYEHVSKAKFSEICKRHGSEVVIKPHPITKPSVIEDMRNFAGAARVAGPHDNLYALIARAEEVYTTHISESALISLLLGKTVQPLGPYRASKYGSFSHINHFCFTEADPLAALESIFASPKSGIIHPEVDTDWRRKVDEYLDYILEKRQLNFEAYFEQ